MSQETSTTGDQPATTAPAGTLYQPTPSTAPRPIAAAGTATTSTPAASNTQPSLNTIQANLSSLLRTPASATHSAQIAAALAPHMTQIMNLAKQGTLTESQMAQVCTVFCYRYKAYASTVSAQNTCGNSCARWTASYSCCKRCPASCNECATPTRGNSTGTWLRPLVVYRVLTFHYSSPQLQLHPLRPLPQNRLEPPRSIPPHNNHGQGLCPC